MLEILNSNQYTPPIIVFVNQKKTADMVAKDLQRAGVRLPRLSELGNRTDILGYSGALRRCIPARTKSSEKLPCNLCGLVTLTFLWPQTLLVAVSTCRTSAWSSTTRWPTPLRHMFTVLVRA